MHYSYCMTIAQSLFYLILSLSISQNTPLFLSCSSVFHGNYSSQVILCSIILPWSTILYCGVVSSPVIHLWIPLLFSLFFLSIQITKERWLSAFLVVVRSKTLSSYLINQPVKSWLPPFSVYHKPTNIGFSDCLTTQVFKYKCRNQHKNASWDTCHHNLNPSVFY